MTTTEKVAYLKGLAEGLGLSKETKEDKLFTAIIDILGDMASDIEDLEAVTDELGEGLDAVSDDLELLENDYYEDYDEDDDDCCCCGDDDCCCCDDGDDQFYEITCPACENTITIDEDVLELGAIDCPNCGERLEFIGLEEDDEDGETPEKPE